MPKEKSRRRSRKPRRKPAGTPRPAPSQRRQRRAQRTTEERRTTAAASRTLGTVGERPASPFAGLPISEIAIFAGIIGLVVGLITGGGPALVVGSIVCGLGVTEVTAREHFSGFRSHSTLLAAVPAVLVEIGVVLAFGVPAQRGLLVLPVVCVWGLCFWLLRRSFSAARHARLARPPAP